MENLRRTTEHLARVAQRQASLRDFSGETFASGPPIILEIGSGHGHFLTAYAGTFPTSICIGLDIISERIQRAMRKRNRAKLANLHFVHANAEDFLATLPLQTRLADIFILFPDPWPKRRHHKNRIMQTGFLNRLAVFCTPETLLHFRTDDSVYFQTTEALLQAHPRWQIVDEPWKFEHETVFQRRAPVYQSLLARLNPLPDFSP